MRSARRCRKGCWAALRARRIPFRAENSSLVYATPEVRMLLLALRAADDPTDELAVVSVLRTPLFGCSDGDLYDWHAVRRQRWSMHSTLPPTRSNAGVVRPPLRLRA